MKIRMSFVSNSSSCSYCIIGEVLDEKKVWDGKLTEKDFERQPILMIGGYTDDGDAICELTYEDYKKLVFSVKIPACKGNVQFITNFGYYEGGEQLNKMHEGKKCRVFCGTRNQNSLEDQLEESYIEGEGYVNF